MQIRTQPKNQIYMSFCGFCYLCSPRDAFESSASRRVSSPNFWVSMVQIDLAALYLIYSPDWPVEPGLNEGHSLPFRIQLVHHLIIGKYCAHSRARGRSGSYRLLIWLTNSIPRHLLTLGTWTGSVNISQVLSVSISPHLNELVRFKHPHFSNGSTVKPLFFNQPYNIPIAPHFQ
jgi:hypothetical protein